MSTESIKKFTEELKAHREKKEITLQQIHNQTRIDIKFLSAIEEGNFDIMPDVYIRAFVKEYAKAIELDSNDTLKKYEKAVKGIYGSQDKTEQETKETVEETEQVKKKLVYSSENLHTLEDDNAKSNKKIIYALSIAVVAIIIIVFFVVRSNFTPEIVKENSYQEILEERNQRYEVVEENENKTQIVDSLELRITAIDTSWIRVIIDESNEQEFILYPNRQKNLKAANEFNLLTGNAGGIEMFLNESRLEFEDPKGSVRNYKIDRNGIQRIITTPVKRDE